MILSEMHQVELEIGRLNTELRRAGEDLAAKMADVIIRVKNGKIQSCEEQENPMSVEEVDW